MKIIVTFSTFYFKAPEPAFYFSLNIISLSKGREVFYESVNNVAI